MKNAFGIRSEQMCIPGVRGKLTASHWQLAAGQGRIPGCWYPAPAPIDGVFL